MISMADLGHIGALVLFYLSAAFDTTDHSILMDVLRWRFRVDGSAPSWVAEFLKNSRQVVHTGETESADIALQLGVLQRSVPGPQVFTQYVQDVQDIVQWHDGFPSSPSQWRSLVHVCKQDGKRINTQQQLLGAGALNKQTTETVWCQIRLTGMCWQTVLKSQSGSNKYHLNQFSCFCRAHICVQHTDHRTLVCSRDVNESWSRRVSKKILGLEKKKSGWEISGPEILSSYFYSSFINKFSNKNNYKYVCRLESR